jgi:hypothetical protein
LTVYAGDATPIIPFERHATVKLSVVVVPGAKVVPGGKGITPIPTESSVAYAALVEHTNT